MARTQQLVQLGGLLRRRRQELGATQLEVAEAMGVTRQWLVRVEAGTGNPDLHQVLRLCEVLDLMLTVAPAVGLRAGLRATAAPKVSDAAGKSASRASAKPDGPALRSAKQPRSARSEPVASGARMAAHDRTRPRSVPRRKTDGNAAAPGLFVDLDDLLGQHKRSTGA